MQNKLAKIQYTKFNFSNNQLPLSQQKHKPCVMICAIQCRWDGAGFLFSIERFQNYENDGDFRFNRTVTPMMFKDRFGNDW